MIVRAFITHKQAENFADCQDRFGVNINTKSIAVSDGMGSSWQQKIWAQLLVEEFVASNEWSPDVNSIKPLCSRWREKVDAFILNLKETNAPEYLINMNERSLINGRSAGATFVGIRFEGKKWKGSILGDSCLIEWDGKETKFHTSQDVEAFDSFPDYFDSDATKEGKGTPKDINGELTKNKCLFLVSDPFSDFLLEHQKRGDIIGYVQKLMSVSSHAEFECLVSEWRANGMHNDDTTFVIVENDESEDFMLDVVDDIDVFIEKEKLGKENEQEKDVKIVTAPIYTSNQIDTNTFIEEFSYKIGNRRKEKKVLKKDVISILKRMIEKYIILKK